MNLGHNWATSAREQGAKRAISSQPRPLRINTGYDSDMPGSHEVEGSNPSRSTNKLLTVKCLQRKGGSEAWRSANERQRRG